MEGRVRVWVIVAVVVLTAGVFYALVWSSPRRTKRGDPGAGGQTAAVSAAVEPPEPTAASSTGSRMPPGDQPSAEDGLAEQIPFPVRNPTGVLKAAFEREPRDALWAEGKEKEIRQVLGDDQLPPDLVQSAACRTTVCRIEMQWNPKSNQGYARLTQLVGKHWAPQVGIDYPPDSRERRALDLYIVRKGYSVADVAQ